MHRFSQDACCCRRRGASVAPYAPGYSCCCYCCTDMSWLPGPTSLHHNGIYQDPYQLGQPASLIGNGIMKAKSVYNNMKQQSRSCGIEDNASFAPTNGRDRTDRQDRQTYRHRTKQPRTMYCLCLLQARKLDQTTHYMHTLAIKIMHLHEFKRLTMDRLKYGPHTLQVPTTQIYDSNFRLCKDNQIVTTYLPTSKSDIKVYLYFIADYKREKKCFETPLLTDGIKLVRNRPVCSGSSSIVIEAPFVLITAILRRQRLGAISH